MRYRVDKGNVISKPKSITKHVMGLHAVDTSFLEYLITGLLKINKYIL